ncbi:MAG: glycosyltransferase [Treponema sp.]|uniref:glycosyltransferase family protein n=1 Tax=Treponema sp. TaxID=166 RepID=UPI0025D7C387|nr:glycosyltransferase [Treponema sp.]MBQ9281040.1 glycosyltransferase [Treponema sp.]
MANIVIGLRNFLQKDNFNQNTYIEVFPPYYEAFLNGLRDAGNNVIVFQAKKVRKEIVSDIPQDFLGKIKNFKPDIFILFNNYFWDVSKYFEVPIVVYDVDSPNAYTNIELLKGKKGRYKYITIQTDGIKLINEIIGCDEKNILYLKPFTEIQARKEFVKNNIAFCGANWLWNNWMPIINFINSEPSKKDRIDAYKVFNYFLENPFKTSDEIYSELNLCPSKKISLNNNFLDGTRVSGIQRLRVLSEVSSLGLEIRGTYFSLKDNTMVPFPEVLLSYSNEIVNNIKTTEDFYNSAKIGLNTKHIQAKSGFSWRVCDILASNACLVSEYAADLTELGFTDVPTFTTPYEAREQCKKLLENENLRKDIVAHSHELINKNHRFKHILPQIEDFTGVTLHSEDEGSLEVIPIFDKTVPPTPQKLPPFPNIAGERLSFKGKVYRKIARYLYNKVEYIK